MICLHCKRELLYERKGLCCSCYRDPTIAVFYPKRPTYTRTGLGMGNHARPLPEPTEALPGSKAKVLVLIERMARGEALWHPHDATGLAENYGGTT